MNEELETHLDKFKNEVLKRFPDEIVSMTLFGSQARGDANENSDIDVLIVTKKKDWRLGDKICDIAYDVMLETGTYISTKVIGQEHYDYLCQLKAPFIENVKKEGRLLI